MIFKSKYMVINIDLINIKTSLIYRINYHEDDLSANFSKQTIF